MHWLEHPPTLHITAPPKYDCGFRLDRDEHYDGYEDEWISTEGLDDYY